MTILIAPPPLALALMTGLHRVGRGLRSAQDAVRRALGRADGHLREIEELQRLASLCERNAPSLAAELRFFACRANDEREESPRTGRRSG